MATNFKQTPPSASSSSSQGSADERDTTVGLLRRLMDEVSTLFRQEVALATAEISRSLSSAKAGVASVATGGAILFAGFLALLAAVVIGLAKTMELWLAALLVGVVTGIVGYLMLHAGRRKLGPSALKPTHTQESLRRDKDVLSGRPS